jgi:hypothetical protein
MKLSWLLILAFALPCGANAEVTIRLVVSGEANERPHVQVDGLTAPALAALADRQLDTEAWNRILTLQVKSNHASALRPVLGEYEVRDDCLVFIPRFPLKPGLKCHATFDPGAIPGRLQRGSRVDTEFSLPARPRDKRTVVEVVYPSADVLPENQLKFYIHFSAPMSRGDSYQHIRLLAADGTAIDAPFLELAEELWDENGRRLTLLLDPGRVKQNLKPNVEVGRAIAGGKSYSLVVSPEWRDAHGEPLGKDFRKEFRVAKADVHQPSPKQWQLTRPPAETREPLVVQFNEPLDHAMLEHAIRVANATGSAIDGSITIDQREARWRYTPTVPWSAGEYQLLIEGTLEDLAGNSIARPFEVHLPAGRPAEIEQYVVPFHIEQASPADLSSE